MRRLPGQISVFFSLMVVMTVSLTAALLESSRFAAARSMLRYAADGAAESVLAEYSLELWQQYDLLFLDAGYGGFGICCEELERRAKDWLESRLAGRHSALSMTAGSVKLAGYRSAMEDGEFLRAVRKWYGYGAGTGLEAVPAQMEDRLRQAAFCAGMLEEMANAADSALEMESLILSMGKLQEEAARPDGVRGEESGEEQEARMEAIQSLSDEFDGQMGIWKDAVKRMGDIRSGEIGMDPAVTRRLEILYNGFLRYEFAVNRRWRQAQGKEVPEVLREDWAYRARAFYDSRCRQKASPLTWLSGVTAALGSGSYGIEPVAATLPAPVNQADRVRDGRVLASYITAHFTSLANKGDGQIRCEQEYLLTGEDSDRDGHERTVRMAVRRLSGLDCLRVLEQDPRWNELLSFSQELTFENGSGNSRTLVLCAYLLNAQGFAAAREQAETLYSGGAVSLKLEEQDIELTRAGLMELMLSETWDEAQTNRCMSLIQHNMRRLNPCFSLDQCLGEVELQVESQGRYPGQICVSMEY